ncbi:MAG: dTMP kinase [Clostridiales Family XIII bacterium]|nr:dTMP kinase [Clostridiales Family XIII bacterium]
MTGAETGRRRGKFITFEGGDGSGKSTQIGLAASWLGAAGYDVLKTREPGGTKIGEKIRAILLDPENADMADMAEMLLYAAARAQLAHEAIAPALEAGQLVVCDRWADSSYVYQGAARGLGEAVFAVNAYAAGALLSPDATILLDLNPEEALQRALQASAGSGHDRIEALGAGYHAKVRAAYLELAERFPKRICVIDAAGAPEAVHTRVKTALSKVLGNEV